MPSSWELANRRRAEGTRSYSEWIDFHREGDSIAPKSRFIVGNSDREVKVLNMVVAEGIGSLTMEQCNALLEEWQTFATPAAEALGMHVERLAGQTHIRRWLSPQSEELLESFSRLANKSTGNGHPNDKERWLTFVVATHVENSECDGDILQRFLTEQHDWDVETAERLAAEFDDQRAVLKHYDETKVK
jgi:hypothetical protein